MAKVSTFTGSYVRSKDFPDIGDYEYDDLKKACDVYYQIKRDKGSCTAYDLQTHFRCTPQRARMLYGAAEFHDKMRKKGLA